MMQTFHTIAQLRAWRAQAGRVAFVPTMGNLHDGHLALVREAAERGDKVVVSIFVNRLQFGQGEDFDRYPRTLAVDAEKLARAGVAVLFAPDERELYPNVAQQYNVEPPNLQNELCGAVRPGHFRGVCTVVAKLFGIVVPDVACFGKKDYQQLMMIRAMVADLNMNVEIVGVDTGRDVDGLALSSRNQYLTAAEREQAPQLYRELQTIAQALKAGERDHAALEQAAKARLNAAGWQSDYVEIRQAETLAVPHLGDKHLVVLAAGRLGQSRLLDNIEVDLV